MRYKCYRGIGRVCHDGLDMLNIDVDWIVMEPDKEYVT